MLVRLQVRERRTSVCLTVSSGTAGRPQSVQPWSVINYQTGNHFQVSFTFFRLFVIVIVCRTKTDDHEKMTDKSPVSDSLKIHLLNHEVRLVKFHLIHSLHHRTFSRIFSASYFVPSPALSCWSHSQPYLPS